MTVTLLVAGCQAAPQPDPRTVFRAALDALSGQTAVAYQVSADAMLNVTRNGLAQGSLPLGGTQVRIVRAGDRLYLQAPPDYWRAHGMSADRAEEYGARWVRDGAGVVPFDPGRWLTPAVAARTLRAALPSDLRPVRGALPDGTATYEAYGLLVTAVPPYRVVSAAAALFGPVVADAVRTHTRGQDATLPVAGLSGNGIAALRSSLDTAVTDLGQPFVAGPAVTTTVTANELTCRTDGSCTDEVRVEHRMTGESPDTGVRLTMTSSVNSADLGRRTCGQEVVVEVNQPARLSCSVNFDLPRRAGSTVVVAQPVVTAEPVAKVDADRLRREVAAELGG